MRSGGYSWLAARSALRGPQERCRSAAGVPSDFGGNDLVVEAGHQARGRPRDQREYVLCRQSKRIARGLRKVGKVGARTRSIPRAPATRPHRSEESTRTRCLSNSRLHIGDILGSALFTGDDWGFDDRRRHTPPSLLLCNCCRTREGRSQIQADGSRPLRADARTAVVSSHGGEQLRSPLGRAERRVGNRGADVRRRCTASHRDAAQTSVHRMGTRGTSTRGSWRNRPWRGTPQAPCACVTEAALRAWSSPAAPRHPARRA